MPESASTGRLPKPLLVLIVTLAVLLVVGVVVAGRVVRGTAGGSDPANAGGNGPYAMPAVAAPKAGSPQCAALVGALPDSLANKGGSLARRKLASPAPKGAAAWGAGEDPVTLRCGVGRPEELTPTSELLDVSGVRWLEVRGKGEHANIVTAYAVDRPVYVALTMPTTVGTGPLQGISGAVARALPAVAVRAGG